MLEHLLKIKLELWFPFLTTMSMEGLCWGLEQPPSEGVVGGGFEPGATWWEGRDGNRVAEAKQN